MSTGSTSSTATPQIPEELKPLFSGAAQQALAVQQGLPLMQAFGGYWPRDISDMGNLTKWGLEDVSSLRQVQPGVLGSMASLATMPEITARPVETPGAESGQYGLLNQLVGGDIGTSPATQQGMQAWEQYVKPTVQHEAVQMGLGRSGPALEAMAQSQTQAFLPLVQQEISNRVNAVNQLQLMANAETQRGLIPREQTLQALTTAASEMRQLADLSFQQQVAAIEEAFRGGKITEDKRQQTLDAAYDEFLRLQALSESATLGPLGAMIPSAIGSKNKSKSSSIDFGQLLSSGVGLAAMSDERVKADVRPTSDEGALETLRDTPISTWRYQGDDERHIGPMAQDAHATGLSRPTDIGGIKAVHLGDMLSTLLRATQAIDRRLQSVEGD